MLFPATVLIVENHPAILDILVRSVQQVRPSARILTAHDGEDALRKAQVDQPDLMIIELAIPKKDGYEVVKSLRHQDNGGRISIIGISSHYFLDNVTLAFRNLCDAFLIKPFYPTELMTKVTKLAQAQDSAVATEFADYVALC